MRFSVCALLVLALGACCVIGGPISDGPEIDLCVSALWNGETPPAGSSALVDFYVMSESVGNWTLVDNGLDVPYPADAAGVLIDTFRFPYEIPTTGEKVTYRYEADLTVAGETYTAADYPDVLICESGEWWWFFAGAIFCSERER